MILGLTIIWYWMGCLCNRYISIIQLWCINWGFHAVFGTNLKFRNYRAVHIGCKKCIGLGTDFFNIGFHRTAWFYTRRNLVLVYTLSLCWSLFPLWLWIPSWLWVSSTHPVLSHTSTHFEPFPIQFPSHFVGVRWCAFLKIMVEHPSLMAYLAVKKRRRRRVKGERVIQLLHLEVF